MASWLSGRPRASTAVFALAACAAFGLAIRDTAEGRAPGAVASFAGGDRALGGGDPAPLLDSGASGELARDGVPSAAERAADEAAEAEAAEALAAFDSAAAARAADPGALDRALRSLLDPGVGPASWLSLSDPSTADRLDALARLGVRVVVEGRQAPQRVQIMPLGDASRLGCAELERAAAAVWGGGRAGAGGRDWPASAGNYRAALRLRDLGAGGCELRIDRTVPPAGAPRRSE